MDLFGARLCGQFVKTWTENSFGESVEWMRVRLPQPTVIGGVGSAQRYVDVAERLVLPIECKCACHLTPGLKADHTCKAVAS
ncbi:hypothetical protein ACJ5H2_05865 [Nocardioides sp. R1-1]|uniref:hypothetical protein n=1 Tax=Nocardioides sp. R1-1 TaxID=3383502 RepID=UPI0038D09B32